MCWNVNTHVRVPPHTRTHAELTIDEDVFHGYFSVCIRFYGRIVASVAARQCPNTYLRFFDGDIVQIIRQAMENDSSLKDLEILEANPSVVQFIMRGKCSFRYGIKQHVILNQESLESSISSFITDNNVPIIVSH